MKNHENSIITWDQRHMTRKSACGRYGVNAFLFLQPLERFKGILDPKAQLSRPEFSILVLTCEHSPPE